MIFEKASELKKEQVSFAMITIINIRGSSPQDLGAKCLVSAKGLEYGTVGGGKVEAHAIHVAKENLETEKHQTHSVTWNLQTDIGMTCGGEVTFLFEYFPSVSWPIVIFGAGHVSQALTKLLSHLSCQVTCIDPRQEWVEKLNKNIIAICHPNPEQIVKDLNPKSFFISMTKGHSSDVPVLLEIAKNFPNAPYIGVIGSKTKGIRIKEELKANEVSQQFLDKLIVPIGLPIGSNDPHEIAISIIAQLLQIRDGHNT